ncbi:MAG: type I-B CRISPR-associated protein Cas7/Cst2/DevR [Hydrogenothermaceae bacterium]|nr:type I-B CRISPR-associated protein Cas7/Cst2/DevR [Hydrogenothermaceae bacterium]
MGLTISVIFDGMSLNYGESTGNISELKKLTKRDRLFTYLSRQALRYELYRTLKELFNIDSDKEEPLTAQQNVIQFKPEANIKDYVEVDLFGYMKTKDKEGSQIRPAVVRVSPAVALEPMRLDTEFGTNLNFAQRLNTNPNLFQQEHQYSLYSYTVTVELDRVGKDKDIELPAQEKARRVNMLLDAIKFLSRNIRGRMENLSPIFAIGGVYSVKNPFFLGRLKVEYDEKGYYLNTDIINSVLKLSLPDNNLVKDKTVLGIVEGYFLNQDKIKELINQDSYDIDRFFNTLKAKVNEYYGVK